MKSLVWQCLAVFRGFGIWWDVLVFLLCGLFVGLFVRCLVLYLPIVFIWWIQNAPGFPTWSTAHNLYASFKGIINSITLQGSRNVVHFAAVFI